MLFRSQKVSALCAHRYISSPSFYSFHLHSRDLFMNKRPSKSLMKESLWWNFHITRLVFLLFKLQNSSWLNLPQKLAVYLSSLLSLLMATLLGFLDDVFDIRWRHKLPIPIIASIPLLMVYYSERGNTNVVVPLPLRFIFGTLINLGKLSYSHNF